MTGGTVSLDSSNLHEGVRLTKNGCDVKVFGANGVLLQTLEGTDIAECVERLQQEQVPHTICVPDQIVQITR